MKTGMYNPIKPYKKEILKEIEKTWRTPYVTITQGVYPIINKKFSYPEIDHTDGIGTKGIYHWQKKTFRSAVIDALAMNLNDLALARAIPYKIQNHITVPQEDESILKIIQAFIRECRQRKIAMTGGENSFHNNVAGLDLSVTMSGFVKSPRPNRCKVGDSLIGIRSSGLHANGFSAIRRIFRKEFRTDFVKPTAIYIDAILEVNQKFKINGMMHITGGAFSKLKDILFGTRAVIYRHPLKPQRIFREIYGRGTTDKGMYTTFNCGVGFVLSSSPINAPGIIKILQKHSFQAAIIGHIAKGTGQVYIESLFSQATIEL